MGKVCSKCKELKPLESFGKRTDSKDGLLGRCKECINAHYRNKYDPKKESIRSKKKYWNNVEGESERKRKYYMENKEKINERNRGYYKRNLEKEAERKRIYHQTERGREVTHNAWQKRRANKNFVKFKGFKRLAIIKRDNWTCKLCGVKVHNNLQNDEFKAELDHIVPLSKGGSSEPSNIQTLCRNCNRSKSNKDYPSDIQK